MELLFQYSLYITLGILSLTTLLILILTPYKYTIDNVRLIIHRFFLLVLCGLQIGFQVLRI